MPENKILKLSKEQQGIIEHTIKNGFFCGGSTDMTILCQLGYMEYAGRKSFVPDQYFKVTSKGKQAVADIVRNNIF